LHPVSFDLIPIHLSAPKLTYQNICVPPRRTVLIHYSSTWGLFRQKKIKWLTT
jgi:hypothetical protein